MEITYNAQTEDDLRINDYLTFTEIPNILKVIQPITGTKSTLEIDIEDGLQSLVSGDGQYSVTVLGETITNVMNPKDAKNKRFFISSDGDSTSFSMCQAFRNCGSLSANFTITHNGNTVHFAAKTLENLFNVPRVVDTNIPDNYFTASIMYPKFPDNPEDESQDFFNGKIIVDVFKNSTATTNYVTTLEKNYYGNECAFDVSPVLATISEYGKTYPYFFNIGLTIGGGIQEGDYKPLGKVSGNTTIGYMANQSDKWLVIDGVKMLMHNRREGQDITRYVYTPIIPYSVLIDDNNRTWNYTVSLKDSAFNQFWSSAYTDSAQTSGYIQEREIWIPQDEFNSAYYVDITLGNDTYRFNVIKPLKATEYYQRVQWYNEYGGISFFDFTGARAETDSVDISTYEKNIFDYYDENTRFERKKIYKNDYEKTVKLTSHLMEENGRWIFNSLMRSKRVWTYVNGYTYYIIPTAIEVAEDSNYNNIYKATLTYKYSDI